MKEIRSGRRKKGSREVENMIAVGLLLRDARRLQFAANIPHKDKGELLGRKDATLVSESRGGRGCFGGRSGFLQLQFIGPVLGLHVLVVFLSRWNEWASRGNGVEMRGGQRDGVRVEAHEEEGGGGEKKRWGRGRERGRPEAALGYL